MSTTIIALIESSLRLLNVIDEEETPSAEQGLKMLHILNDLLADAYSDGIDLGWRPIDDADISLDAPLAPADVRAVKLWLAIEAAPHFGVEPLPTLKELGNDAYAKLAKRAIKFVESDVSGLPIAESTDYTIATIANG